MLIGLTYDLRQAYLAQGFGAEETAEFDKPETIAALREALQALGHRTDDIGNVYELVGRLAAGERWDLVFNIAEGLYGYGREALVPALLDAYRIPYTFSDPAVLAVALHKGLTKRVVRDAGLPTPPFVVLESAAAAAQVDLPFPLFAKPVAEGTSKGIGAASRVSDLQSLASVCQALLDAHHQPVLVEGYLPGREFTVGILGAGDTARVLGVMEVLIHTPAEGEVYGYQTKEQYLDRVQYRLAADPEARQAADVALAAWRCLGCRDAGRVDLRSDGAGRPHFIEVNPLAGLNPVHSDLPILCRLLGREYLSLIRDIVDAAAARVAELPPGRFPGAVASRGAAALAPQSEQP